MFDVLFFGAYSRVSYTLKCLIGETPFGATNERVRNGKPRDESEHIFVTSTRAN